MAEHQFESLVEEVQENRRVARMRIFASNVTDPVERQKLFAAAAYQQLFPKASLGEIGTATAAFSRQGPAISIHTVERVAIEGGASDGDNDAVDPDLEHIAKRISPELLSRSLVS